MTSEEKFIFEKFGKQQPFTVPKGYFDGFTSSLMGRLPEEETLVAPLAPKPLSRYRTWFLAAASVLAFVFCLNAYVDREKAGTAKALPTGMQAKASVYSDIDAAADYVMFDNEDIYAYVSSDHEY